MIEMKDFTDLDEASEVLNLVSLLHILAQL